MFYQLFYMINKCGLQLNETERMEEKLNFVEIRIGDKEIEGEKLDNKEEEFMFSFWCFLFVCWIIFIIQKDS